MSKYAYVIEQSSGSKFETVGVATSIENAKKVVKEQELKESATTVYKIPFDSYGYHDKEWIDRLIWSHEMNKDDDGPALPGMSLRDWLAGMALGSLLTQDPLMSYDDIAKACYKMADTMLKERENDSTS